MASQAERVELIELMDLLYSIYLGGAKNNFKSNKGNSTY